MSHLDLDLHSVCDMETISKRGQRCPTVSGIIPASCLSPPLPAWHSTLASRFCATRCCMPTPDSPTVYHLRIRLDRISPLIWRRLLVTSETTIAELHATIQIPFG